MARGSARSNVSESKNFEHVSDAGIGGARWTGHAKKEGTVKKGKTTKAKRVRNLPAKAINSKTGRGVKGGVLLSNATAAQPRSDEGPEESITFVYGKLGVKYTPQS
jgi:hypothetical protein